MRSPWAWFSDLFAKRGEDPMRQVRYVLPWLASGVTLTADETLSISTVWACIDVIARAVASVRWNIYQPIAANKRTLLFDDPLMWRLNTAPNPEMTAIGFREAMMMQAIPFGNSYAEIVKDRRGQVSELWPLFSDRVTPKRDVDWKLVYEYRQPDGSLIFLQPSQVFHLRGPGLYGLMGENIVARAAKSIAVAAAQERYSASFFGQGASPTGVLEYPGKMTEEVYERLKKDWAEKKKGADNAHKPMILESGMKFTPVSIDPQKSQLVEGRQFSVTEICRWFGVPPHKVQHLLNATFSNIEHSSIEFVRDALTPWAKRLAQEADAKLFRQDRAPWKETELDLRPLSQGDAASRAAAAAIWRQNGIMTANEIRSTEGLDDLGEDGDVLLVQSNLTTIDRIVNPPAAPPALGPGPLGDKKAPELPAGDDSEDPTTDKVAAVAREALQLFVANSLDRYARKLTARRTDLQRVPSANASDVDRMMREARAQAFSGLASELKAPSALAARVLGYDLDLVGLEAALDCVIGGEPAAFAAARALPASCPQAG